jgi:hypothetical protein
LATSAAPAKQKFTKYSNSDRFVSSGLVKPMKTRRTEFGMPKLQPKLRWLGVLFAIGLSLVSGTKATYASDHLDTPTVIADPAADIGDLFARISVRPKLDC